jgi:predicted acylesterase/phospholipase RssA
MNSNSPLTSNISVVLSTHTQVNKPARLRSYASTWEPSTHCMVWEAARATSAAPLFFDPITFGVPPLTYGDGGLHYNNPIRVAMDESRRIWAPSSGQQVGVIVSIGTGKPPLRDLGRKGHEIILSLKDIATDTEQTAEDFADEINDMEPATRPKYFRFNVEQGTESVGLEEWDQFDRLTAATNAYLKAHRKEVEDCVESLLQLAISST